MRNVWVVEVENENSGTSLKIHEHDRNEKRTYAKITTPFHKYNRYRKYNEKHGMETHLISRKPKH
jgi:hypothetical protein